MHRASIPREQWSKLIEQYRSSGMTKTEWCRQNGYGTSQLQNWIKRIGSEEGVATTEEKAIIPGFIEISRPIPEPVMTRSASCIKVVVEQDRTAIEITEGFSPDMLKTVVSTLRQIC